MFKSTFIIALLIPFMLLKEIACALNSQAIKPMSYEEIIKFAKPQWVEMSASGMQVAFCVRKGSIEKNHDIDTLYLLDIKSGQQKIVVEFEKIMETKWENEDKDIYVLGKEDNRYKIICYHDGRITSLVESEVPIYVFSLSPDGSALYYTKIKNYSPEVEQKEIEEGHVYNLGKDYLSDIMKGNYKRKEHEEIWCLNLHSGKSELITFLPSKEFDGVPLINSLSVSNDNRRLLVSFRKVGRPDLGGTPFEDDVIVWDSTLKEWYDPLNNSIYVEDVNCWISEKEFIFQQIVYSTDGMSTPTYFIWLFDANSRQGQRLDWLNISDEIKKFQWNKGVLYGIGENFLYKICLDEKKIEQIEIPTCFRGDRISFDAQACRIGLINQSIEHPPEVAVYDIHEKKLTRLTSLNPQIQDMDLGKVEEITVKTNSGVSATGFLIHPVGEQPGTRYPIIIGTYQFRGKFITDAEWHSSFPAQTLAGKGYLVLLLNAPGSSQGFIGDIKAAKQAEGWDKLELLEQAVDLLVKRGIADPNKVGIYGWSHGAFIVNFVISHSQKFHVACLGEGGDFNPGGFWLGGRMIWPEIFESTFGGPPWGETLKNYLDFSPFFQVDKIRTPLLMEFTSDTALGFEMYIPLRYLDVPAELVFYDGEEHNFVNPKARIASMARKLEWFDYWLFDKRNPDPTKIEQYERWNSMRDEAIKKRKV